jgi:hypothetical protein
VTEASAREQARVLGELLRGVNRTWDQIVTEAPVVVRRLRIAEIDVEVVIAGDELADGLLPGFACHPPAAGPPRATVGAWDAAATGHPFPARPSIGDPRTRRWVLRHDGRPLAELDWDGFGMFRTGDRCAGRHLLGVASAAARSPWESGAPLRRQLWWALSPEVLFVHAGGVGDRGGAALVMGPAGSGKSTTSLACLRAGMGFLGDDYCLVRDGQPPTAHLLYATARVDEKELAHLGHLAQPVPLGGRLDAATEEAKALLHPAQTAPDQLLMSAPVRVVLIPTLSGEASPRLVPVSGAEALRTLAPRALWQMHLEAQRELEGLRKLLAAVPTYRLVLSDRRHLNPGAVQQALSRATAA